MIVAGMMRVRNEARWIKRAIESILPVCNAGVAVFDDRSTDGTAEIAAGIPSVALMRSPFTGLNEARDKNFLLAAMAPCDWIIAIDGDEELHSCHLVNLAAAMQTSKADSLSLPIWYLWDREDQMRVDGVYGNYHRESVFRPRPGATFHEGPPPNFHCGNVPPMLRDRQVLFQPCMEHHGRAIHLGHGEQQRERVAIFEACLL